MLQLGARMPRTFARPFVLPLFRRAFGFVGSLSPIPLEPHTALGRG